MTEDKAFNMLSGHTPESFLKPCLVVSTFYATDKNEQSTQESDRSTALFFGEALDHKHLIWKIYDNPHSRGGDWRSDWVGPIIIQEHDSVEDATNFHSNLARELMDREKYLELLEEYYPEEMR